MQTVLSICQQALYDIGIVPPSSITSTTDATQLQLKNILYAQARALRNLGGFKQQKRKWKFVLKAGRSQYPLPPDYYSMCGDTAYDQGQSQRVGGPLSDSDWNSRLHEYQINGTPYFMRAFGPDFNTATGGGQLEINPPPESSGTVVSFDYITSTLFLPPHWVASTAYAAVAPDRV